MYQKYYKEFLESHKEKVHMAAHSHHFWPDISKEGHLKAWEIAKNHSDNKWEYLLGDLLPDVQEIISKIINFSRPADISFASNTHELLVRMISCFFHKPTINILTTTNEFHSLSRQVKRFEELENYNIEYIDPDQDDFSENLRNKLEKNEYDIIFISHIFFNTGKILSKTNIESIIELKKNAQFILDGYHSFCAVPVDISRYEDDIYYLSGGYKYAQAGEGMCFMTLPSNCNLRPAITGWFASFETLDSEQSEMTAYSKNGMRFWGATLDMTSFLRFSYVWNFFYKNGLDVDKFDQYIKSLQLQFLNQNNLSKYFTSLNVNEIGHFITAELSDTEKAKSIHNLLKSKGIITDFRGNRLRFGFGPYLSQQDIETVKVAINSI